MKKNKSYIIIIGLLAAVAIYFYTNEKQGTLKIATNYFAITDTSEIASIQIIKNQDTLMLEKAGENWVINRKYNARPKTIRVLMGLFSTIEIKAPISKSIKTHAINCFHRKAICVKFETKTRLDKEFEICESDSIDIGSFIREPGSDDIYTAAIPGYSGKLGLLLPVKQDIWRDNIIFRNKPWEILSIKVEYPDKLGKSFVMDLSDPEKIEITGYMSKKTVQLNKEEIVRYLFNFKLVKFESIPRYKRGLYDSLQHSVPGCIIIVKGIEDQYTKVKTYAIPSPNKKGEIDLFKMYAVIQNDSIPVYINYVDFDPIMKSLKDFTIR